MALPGAFNNAPIIGLIVKQKETMDGSNPPLRGMICRIVCAPNTKHGQ